jgi:Ser/Thr protein kinase RdoA (MazF antagonist)
MDSGMTEQQRKLAGAVKNVGNMLAKLHAAAEEADKAKIQQEVVALTKEVRCHVSRQFR